MKKLLLLCCLLSSPSWALQASNVVQNVNSYTGQVVSVSGKVDKVQKESLSSCSYVVIMQGLFVRVFFDTTKKAMVNGRLKPVTFDSINKPSIGSSVSYSGVIKMEMGKPFLITPKKE